MDNKLYKKLPIEGYWGDIRLNSYPVYVEDLYYGHEPFKIVGIRENELELQGDFSGGTHNVSQKSWIDIKTIFTVSTVCPEQIKPNGCQVHNVNCCGGGTRITEHTNYWDNLINQ